ncbi:MAG: hypothetical protein J5988_06800, partial [Eubacterium sp.]|nr:hypothetical protein [Eubacterium sp.]
SYDLLLFATSACGMEVIMQRLIGFILFWIGIGMCIMLFLHHGLLALCIIIACLVLGYNLFSCK